MIHFSKGHWQAPISYVSNDCVKKISPLGFDLSWCSINSSETNQYTSEWIFNDQVNMISFLHVMKWPNTHVSSLNWLTDSWCIVRPGLTEPRCWSDDRPRVTGYGAWPSRRTAQTLWNKPSVLQNNKFIYMLKYRVKIHRLWNEKYTST